MICVNSRMDEEIPGSGTFPLIDTKERMYRQGAMYMDLAALTILVTTYRLAAYWAVLQVDTVCK